MVVKAALALLVVAVLAFGFVKHEDRVREQNGLAKIASELAGHKVGVRCPTFFGKLVDVRGEAGRVQFDDAGRPAGHTDLSPGTCAQLKKLPSVDFSCLANRTCSYKQFKAGWAAHTLAHEAFHLRGYEDEGIAECYALQNTAFVANRLGVNGHLAEELQAWIFSKGYPNEPQDYHAAGCYDGGPLDLHPRSNAWP